MKFVFAIALIMSLPLRALTQCQDFSINVKDSYGYPLKNSTVKVEYLANHSIETKQTNDDGDVVFNCQLVGAKPYVKLIVSSPGYAPLSRNEHWNGKLSRNIILTDNSNYKQVRVKVSGHKAVVKSDIKEVDTEIQKKKEKSFSNPSKNSEDANSIAEYERIKADLEVKQQEYDDLLRESSTHHKSAEAYQALYETKNKDYEELRKKFQDLKNKIEVIETDIAIELYDCKCEGWDNNYLKISIRLKDGRNKAVLTAPIRELAVDITKEGSNTSEGESLLFDNPEDSKKFYFSLFPNSEGFSQIIIMPKKGEFERTFKMFGDNHFNYRITFYNRALFKYRDIYKISSGTFIIKDIKEDCGKRKKLDRRA